jgi:hypothetical protein
MFVRGQARVMVVQALRLQSVDFQLQMRLDLILEVALRPA